MVRDEQPRTPSHYTIISRGVIRYNGNYVEGPDKMQDILRNSARTSHDFMSVEFALQNAARLD